MKNLLDCVMDIGEEMLFSGAEVHRVEDSVVRMCTALGATRTDVFIITSSMVVTIHTNDGKTHTQTRRITSSAMDFERLHHLNQLSREICEQKLDENEIRTRLAKAKQCKTYPFWFECLCYAAIAGAFTLFFGGGFLEMLVSFFTGALVRVVILLCNMVITNKIFQKFISAIVATLIAFLAVKLSLVPNVDKIIIGNIMSLIPGIGLTNALRDLFTGDSIAGILRVVEAVLTALAIAAGYFIVSVLGGIVL